MVERRNKCEATPPIVDGTKIEENLMKLESGERGEVLVRGTKSNKWQTEVATIPHDDEWRSDQRHNFG